MPVHSDKPNKHKSKAVSQSLPQKQSGAESTFQFADKRPETVAQRKLQEVAENSPQAKYTAQLQAMADNYTAAENPIQKKENNTGLPDKLKSGIESLRSDMVVNARSGAGIR